MKQYAFLILAWALLGGLYSAQAEEISFRTAEGFAIPQPHANLVFPRDHGSHPDYKIEWWYLTGHLFTNENQRFGYQATFFRLSLRPEDKQNPNAFFGTDMAFMSHFALTDPQSKRFYFDEELARNSWDAYASKENLDVRIYHNTLRALDFNHSQFHLKGAINSDVVIDFLLSVESPLVRFGEDGTSQKGPDPSARSYYLSFTDLKTEGSITINGSRYQITGSSWMDHEIASNQLDEELIGWDWTAIQLKDGWKVKAYLLRGADNKISPFSACIWISPDNSIFYQSAGAFNWLKPSFWKSPNTGVEYPISPLITTTHPKTGEDVTFKLIPLMENQELSFSNSQSLYWEGACTVHDRNSNEIGSAYLELVGYAGPVEGLR